MHDYSGVDDSLLGRIGSTIDEYRDARDEYWSADPAGRALLDVYEMLAKAFLADSNTLISIPADSKREGSAKDQVNRWDRFMEALGKADETAILFDQGVEIGLVDDAWHRLQGSTERCLGLAQHILRSRPSEPVERYLKRLSRCYIAGFMPECIILCRAILENAIADKFARHSVPLPETERGRSPMRTRLAAARLLGWLTEDGERAAQRVWLRGNKAVHDDPEATTDVRGTIELTSKVLFELYQQK